MLEVGSPHSAEERKWLFHNFLLPELDVRALPSALHTSQIFNIITTASDITDSLNRANVNIG